MTMHGTSRLNQTLHHQTHHTFKTAYLFLDLFSLEMAHIISPLVATTHHSDLLKTKSGRNLPDSSIPTWTCKEHGPIQPQAIEPDLQCSICNGCITHAHQPAPIILSPSHLKELPLQLTQGTHYILLV